MEFLFSYPEYSEFCRCIASHLVHFLRCAFLWSFFFYLGSCWPSFMFEKPIKTIGPKSMEIHFKKLYIKLINPGLSALVISMLLNSCYALALLHCGISWICNCDSVCYCGHCVSWLWHWSCFLLSFISDEFLSRWTLN